MYHQTHVLWVLCIILDLRVEVLVHPPLINTTSLLLCYSPLTYLRFPDCAQMTVLQVSDDLEANLGLGGLIPPPFPPISPPAQLSHNVLLLVTEEKWNSVASDRAIPVTHTHASTHTQTHTNAYTHTGTTHARLLWGF